MWNNDRIFKPSDKVVCVIDMAEMSEGLDLKEYYPSKQYPEVGKVYCVDYISYADITEEMYEQGMYYVKLVGFPQTDFLYSSNLFVSLDMYRNFSDKIKNQILNKQYEGYKG